MRARRALLSAVLPLLGGAACAANGLLLPGDAWPQWQARITVTTATLSPVSLLNLGGPAEADQAVQSGALLGDFYLDAPGLRLPASTGGLRASGGLLVGPRGLALGGVPQLAHGGRLALQSGLAVTASEAAADTVPYLGVGYTGLALKGGWGITADLGLVAERPGRVLLGNASANSALREMRLSPVLQLGLRYSF